jgi:hypothetical protein
MALNRKRENADLRCGVNWQKALKQKGVKQISVPVFFPEVKTARA